MLRDILRDTDAQGQAVLVGALRDSAANAFHLRHGFELVSETEWDLHYRREPH